MNGKYVMKALHHLSQLDTYFKKITFCATAWYLWVFLDDPIAAIGSSGSRIGDCAVTSSRNLCCLQVSKLPSSS